MAWREASRVIERQKFILELGNGERSFAEVCRAFGISRQTGYKWVERYDREGPEGLKDRSHARHHHPNAMSLEVITAILALRRGEFRLGPKKIRELLLSNPSGLKIPAASAIGRILVEHGLVRPRRWRPRLPITRDGAGEAEYANQLWAIDFKGQFPLADQRCCYPLTITDHSTRYLLSCQALTEPKTEPVRRQMEAVFREYGLPDKIHSDNGVPFASVGIGGLSALSVWWLKLGIGLERSRPGHPQDNGRHERMHRTLKETLTGPALLLDEQQQAFDRFRGFYNEQRPHEALGQKPPGKVYTSSRRSYPNKLVSPEYDSDKIVRRLSHSGALKFKGQRFPLAQFLANEPVGIEQQDEDVWQLFYGSVLLGELRLKDKALELIKTR